MQYFGKFWLEWKGPKKCLYKNYGFGMFWALLGRYFPGKICKRVTSMFSNKGEGLVFWFAWMDHCTIQWLFSTIWNVVGALKARALCRTNHDVHAHRRTKNNRNWHDACTHHRALTSPVTPSLAELFNVYQPQVAREPVMWSRALPEFGH